MESEYFFYWQISGIIKTNGLITLSKYPVKYLGSVSALIIFEITILPTLTFQMFIGFLQHNFFCWFFYLSKSQHCYTIKNILWLVFI